MSSPPGLPIPLLRPRPIGARLLPEAHIDMTIVTMTHIEMADAAMTTGARLCAAMTNAAAAEVPSEAAVANTSAPGLAPRSSRDRRRRHRSSYLSHLVRRLHLLPPRRPAQG